MVTGHDSPKQNSGRTENSEGMDALKRTVKCLRRMMGAEVMQGIGRLRFSHVFLIESGGC
jgi:hypothetical protein